MLDDSELEAVAPELDPELDPPASDTEDPASVPEDFPDVEAAADMAERLEMGACVRSMRRSRCRKSRTAVLHNASYRVTKSGCSWLYGW